ncbi:MAG: hypothetical protein GEV10_12335 [Streptosporangiales bacterium]|nr:hypothetical protein [Streptosporangiales bacterium]
MAIVAVSLFTLAFALIASERVNRVVAVLLGVAAMSVVGIVDTHTAFFSEETGVDWNVIFLLFGMMMVVSVTKQTGLFEYLAIWAAKRSGGRPFRLMVMLVVVTALISAFLDSVTVMLLVAPVTFAVCGRLALPPVPFVLAEVFAANIGGTATLIGDPPNIMIGLRAGLSFDDFLVNLAPITVVLLLVFLGLCRIMFRSALQYHPERVAAMMAMDEDAALKDRAGVVKCLAVIGLVIVGFVLHTRLGLEPSVIAMLGAGLIVLVNRSSAAEFLEEVEWETLVFFMGLFVLVGGLVHTGVIDAVGKAAIDVVGDRYLLAAGGLMAGSTIIGGIIDTIPFVATMLPIVEEFGASIGDAGTREALWWALALGADLGGNATAVGASANVVAIGVARSQGHPISFWTFTKYGIVVAGVTVPLAFAYVWLRYFL